MDNDMSYLKDNLKLDDISIPHLNKSSHKHFIEYIKSDSLKQDITEIFEKDFRLLNY